LDLNWVRHVFGEGWGANWSARAAACDGKACIPGTQVLVLVILDNIAAGVGGLALSPSLQSEDVNAALAYAAELAAIKDAGQ
jgi:uncharacterized protein (DUF433 family)